MTDDRLDDRDLVASDPAQLDDDRQRGAEALAALADEPARAEFRARLRQSFVAGVLGVPAARPKPLGGGRWRRARMVAVAAPLAAAAALVVVLAMDRGPAWRVTHVSGEGIAVVDQRPVPLGHVAELSAALRPGARVRVPEGAEIEVTAGALAVRMMPGTDSFVPPTPGRWFGRSVTGRIEHGQWRITTGPAFAGARLEIETPHADIEVTGTTLSVICEPEGTCVCVFEGRVRVGRAADDMALVQEGHLRYMYAGGGPPKEGSIRPDEHEQLGRFRDEKRAEFERRR